MAEHDEDQGRLTRAASFIFLHTEHAIYAALGLLMLIEILHTVRVSMRSGKLTVEPFLIVGLIASIRRVLVITLQSSELTHAKDFPPEKYALFQAAMIELGVLAGLIIVMVFAIFLLHRARDDGKPAGEESHEHAGG